MTTIPNPPVLGIQQPTVNVSGKVVYKSGPWGTAIPVRKMSVSIMVTQHPSGTTVFDGSSLGGMDGTFRVKSSFITSAFSRITLRINEDFTGQQHDEILFPGWISPNQRPEDLGEISFPFEPEHSELAWVNSTPHKDTQGVAAGLARILQSGDTHVFIELLSESRGTESIPIDDLADHKSPLVVSRDGKVFTPPVPRGTQQERYRDKQADARFIREQLKNFRPIPILTPAQKLLNILKAAGIPKDFPQRLIKEINVHKLALREVNASVEGFIATLEHFSLAKIFHLETPGLLNRINRALQRAAKQTFVFQTLKEEAATDMSAACALVFLAGFMAKHNAVPNIVFNYWHEFSRGTGMTENRPYVKIIITASK